MTDAGVADHRRYDDEPSHHERRRSQAELPRPQGHGQEAQEGAQIVLARGCRVKIRYLVSKKAKNTVLAQSRKAGKKLGFRTIVKLTIAKQAVAKAKKTRGH